MEILKIIGITDDTERAFYGSSYVDFEDIKVDGLKDGESAFKECDHIKVSNSLLNLRYPFWHDDFLEINTSYMGETCRAPLWYCTNVKISELESYSIKPLRECKNVQINNSKFKSDEFSWKVKNISILNSEIDGFYSFFECQDIAINNLTFKGKYSFQYCENIYIKDSNLDTKDAFWHSKNVKVENSIVKGEYLGWYSENLTLINCTIIGTQPLCYCKNLTLINCKFEQADFAFEYSEVNGNIIGTLISIKNPISGTLTVDTYPEVIIDAFDQSNGEFTLLENENI